MWGCWGPESASAQRWIAVGSERFGEGDITFARRALEQARRWGSRTPELDELRGALILLRSVDV